MKDNQVSLRDAKDMWRVLKHERFLCLWAEGVHTVSSLSVDSLPMARRKHCYLGGRWCGD